MNQNQLPDPEDFYKRRMQLHKMTRAKMSRAAGVGALTIFRAETGRGLTFDSYKKIHEFLTKQGV